MNKNNNKNFCLTSFNLFNFRYNFLIYNSSIVYWKYARAFLKTNCKKHLCATLLKITQSLKEIDDADYEWRSFLEKTLIEAYLDDKKTTEANKLANELLKFTQSYMPENLDAYFKFLVSLQEKNNLSYTLY